MVKRFHEKAGKYQKAVCAAISIFAFVCIWQMAVAFTKAGLVLAGPIETLGAFFTAILHPIGTHTIEGHILWSLGRGLIGFAFGSLAGTVLGILMGWFKPVSALLRPIFELLRPIPPIAWIPLSIVWFGLGEMVVNRRIARAWLKNLWKGKRFPDLSGVWRIKPDSRVWLLWWELCWPACFLLRITA